MYIFGHNSFFFLAKTRKESEYLVELGQECQERGGAFVFAHTLVYWRWRKVEEGIIMTHQAGGVLDMISLIVSYFCSHLSFLSLLLCSAGDQII